MHGCADGCGGRADGGRAETRGRTEPEVIFFLFFHPEIISGGEDSKKGIFEWDALTPPAAAGAAMLGGFTCFTREGPPQQQTAGPRHNKVQILFLLPH